MIEYINIIVGLVFFLLIVLILILLLDNSASLKKSNNRVYNIESQILDKIDILTSDSLGKDIMMKKIFESVQNNERETNFLYKKVDLLTQDFYKRIIEIEKDIKNLKEKLNDNI